MEGELAARAARGLGAGVLILGLGRTAPLAAQDRTERPAVVQAEPAPVRGLFRTAQGETRPLPTRATVLPAAAPGNGAPPPPETSPSTRPRPILEVPAWIASGARNATHEEPLGAGGASDGEASRVVLLDRAALDAVLAAWERESRRRGAPARAEAERLRFAYRETHSAHELAIAELLRGPVESAALRARFEWPEARRVGDRIVFEARVKDEMDRLFTSGFRLVLDAEQSRPLAMRFRDRQGTWKPDVVALDAQGLVERLALRERQRRDGFAPDPTVLRVSFEELAAPAEPPRPLSPDRSAQRLPAPVP